MNNSEQDILKPDICIIGAGAGGLSVAAGAAQMGARTVLIESGTMGGDCLNVGCVPSKSLLAAAHSAENTRSSERLGVSNGEPQVSFAAVHSHVQGVIDSIRPTDSVERYQELGATVLRSRARFTDANTLTTDDGSVIKPRRIVIATGSRAVVPPIPGLEDVNFLTNDTIFELTERPDHLLIIGGGPIGAEMAQAHRQLGSRVSIFQKKSILGKDDPESVEVLRQQLKSEGVEIFENTEVESVASEGETIRLSVAQNGQKTVVAGSHLLVAAGRAPVVDTLDLEAGGVAYDKHKGIDVDKGLRSTSNKRVYAVGDVSGHPKFTHVCSYHASIVLRRALFHLPASTDYSALPWVTYTDPEVAQVGLTEEQARAEHSGVEVWRAPFAENDRARSERRTQGFCKIIARGNGRVLGASVVGPHAGEIIGLWALAIQQKLKVGDVAQTILPYPTFGEISKQAAGKYYQPRLFTDRTEKLIRFMAFFG